MMNNWQVVYTDPVTGKYLPINGAGKPADLELVVQEDNQSRTTSPAWHHVDCEGECIACLIERLVQKEYGNQGLAYLCKHVYNKT